MSTFFIRHGMSVANEQNIVQGHFDSPLAEAGILEAERVSIDHFRRVSFIISSPLQRARQTAEILSRRLGVPVRLEMWEFAERHLGVYQGLVRSEAHALAAEITQGADVKFMGETIPGGESLTDFRARINRGLTTIAEIPKFGDLIVVTHAGVLRQIGFLSGTLPSDITFTNLGYLELP